MTNHPLTPDPLDEPAEGPGEEAAPAALAPEATPARTSFAWRLLRLGWRWGLGLVAMGLVLASLGAVAALVGIWGLLWTMQKDLTLGPQMKYWPKWLWSFDVLQRYSTYYLVGAGVVLFVVLPLLLALLEHVWYWGYRPRR